MNISHETHPLDLDGYEGGGQGRALQEDTTADTVVVGSGIAGQRL